MKNWLVVAVLMSVVSLTSVQAQYKKDKKEEKKEDAGVGGYGNQVDQNQTPKPADTTEMSKTKTGTEQTEPKMKRDSIPHIAYWQSGVWNPKEAKSRVATLVAKQEEE